MILLEKGGGISPVAWSGEEIFYVGADEKYSNPEAREKAHAILEANDRIRKGINRGHTLFARPLATVPRTNIVGEVLMIDIMGDLDSDGQHKVVDDALEHIATCGQMVIIEQVPNPHCRIAEIAERLYGNALEVNYLGQNDKGFDGYWEERMAVDPQRSSRILQVSL